MSEVVIDVSGLSCPQPVIKVKDALKQIREGKIVASSIEIVGDSKSSFLNIDRFLKNNGYLYTNTQDEDGFCISISGRSENIDEINNSVANDEECGCKVKIVSKTLVFKNDKIGEGDLGGMLVRGFLKTLIECEQLPERIVFMNRGVYLTTNNNEISNSEIISSLKELEKAGVKIFSCGSCLGYFGLLESLVVGEVGNGLEILNDLISSDSVISL